MTAVSVRLPEELKNRLARLSERTGRSRASYMVEALNEHIGDMEALFLAEQRLTEHRAGRSKSFTQEEMEKRYGVADRV